MTRKEEIKRAAINRADKHEFNEAKRRFGLLGLNLYSYSTIWKTEIDSFKAGAAWADENSKSPWISVKDDLPCFHKELLDAKYQTKKVFIIKDSFGNADIDYMIKNDNKWRWFSYTGAKYWFPIPELPKEE